MKRTAIAFTMACFLVASAFAARIAWKANEEPPVSLRLALALAEEELKAEEVPYYCLSAGFIGRWELHFGSKAGKEMWVAVGRDKAVSKSKEPFDH